MKQKTYIRNMVCSFLIGATLASLIGFTARIIREAIERHEFEKQQVILEEEFNVPIGFEEIEEKTYNIEINPAEAEMLAKLLYGEARGCSFLNQSAVVWCVLNRVDAWQMTIEEVITAKNQFVGYKASNPVWDNLLDMAEDVLTRWQMEQQGATAEEVGRTLPKDYLWFNGDADQFCNIFRNKYDNYSTWNVWTFDCVNPYEEQMKEG